MKNKNLIFKNNLRYFNREKYDSRQVLRYLPNAFLKFKNNLCNTQKTEYVLDKKFNFSFSFSELRKFKRFQTIAIIGMGGSILGIEAIYKFLEKKIKKKVYFFDDINEKKLIDFNKEEIISKTLFIVISKSGNTIETLSNVFTLNIIKKKADNIIIISERKNNFLYNLSKNLNLFFIEHKKNIGGRYSVLSEVGIVPAYLIGINILKLRSKLVFFEEKTNQKFLKESVVSLAQYLNSKKYNNLVFLNYAPELEKLLFWCQQLIAESLGKKGKGFLPIISNVPKDHHSLLQLYLDGPKDKIFYIFSTKSKSKRKVNLKNYIDKKNSLDKKSLQTIKDAQKDALIKSLIKIKAPFREFIIKNINEETLGTIFSYFITETIITGRICKINPFNQPAVEQVKIKTEILLKKSGQK